MYIIVIGSGRLGSTVARELSGEHDVVVIDRHNENLERLGISFNGRVIQGTEFDVDVLKEAGIEKADVVLSLTPDDNTNIMALQTAKEIFGVKEVIGRVSNQNMMHIYKALGIEIISPIRLAVDVIKTRVFNKGEIEITALNNDISIMELHMRKNRKKVEDIETEFECSVNAIIRYGELQLTTKDDIIHKGDNIICTVHKKNKSRIIEALTKESII